MKTLKSVLVALSDEDDARFVMDKAVALARASDARLNVVRVIYEGVAELKVDAITNSTRLKTFILEASESLLNDMLDPWRSSNVELESATLWNSRTWEGILHAAESVQADLIVKAASVHPEHGSVVRTPDDWNLLRQATVPVMLVKPEAWVANPVVLCALDAFDDDHRSLNVALLEEASVLANRLDGSLHIVCAYPLFEPWVGQLGAVGNYAEIKQSVEKEIIQRVDDLSEAADVDFSMLHVEEGKATLALASVVEDTSAELLVIGTHARQGLQGLVLGNTSERVLHAIGTDVVTVSAPD